MTPPAVVAGLIVLWLLLSVKVLNEYERGVVFRLGKVQPGPKGPGLVVVAWPIDRDYSLLSVSETGALEATERLRNSTACAEGRGYCDPSRLTPAEAAAIPAEPGVASSIERKP